MPFAQSGSGSFSGAIGLSGYLVPGCGSVPALGSVLTYGVNAVCGSSCGSSALQPDKVITCNVIFCNVYFIS